jgi:hypothetical protein
MVSQKQVERDLWNRIPELTIRPNPEPFWKASFGKPMGVSFTPTKRMKNALTSSWQGNLELS